MIRTDGKRSTNHADWTGRSDCGRCEIHDDVLIGGEHAEDIDRLLRPVTSYRLAPRSVLYHQAGTAESVFVVRKGLVKLISYLQNGRPRIVRLHRRADVIGIEGLMGLPYGHSAVAVSDVEICRIPVSALLTLRDQRPNIYCLLVERWYQYLQRADVWITEFSTGTVRARVAHLIAFLSEIEQDKAPEHVELLTGEDMAAILGVTVESVSRVIAEFKRERVLTPVRGGASRELYEFSLHQPKGPLLGDMACNGK